MSILEESAARVLDRLGPVGEALTVDRLVVGLFFTGVKLSDGAGGVCYTPVKEIPEAVCCPSSAGRVFDPVRATDRPAAEFLGALGSREPLKRAVAVAVLNALTASAWDRASDLPYTIERGRDAQDLLPLGTDGSVAVVGALVPVMRRLKQRGGRWWVVEQDPRTLRPDERPHFVPWEQADEILTQADVLVVTGVTLLNGTLEPILENARPDAFVAVLGPTASMEPEPLFARGVDVAGGVWVRRADRLLDVLAAGGSGYHVFDELAERVAIRRATADG